MDTHTHTSFASSFLTTRRRPVVTQIRYPVRVFSHLHIQCGGNPIYHGRKKVNVLDENVRILHTNNPGAFEFPIFEIEMQFSTTLVLSCILPIGIAGRFRGERNGNDSAFGQGLGGQTVNDILNLTFHTVSIISLLPTTFRTLPLTGFFHFIRISHVLFGIVQKSSCWKQFCFNGARFDGDILNHTHKVAYDVFSALNIVLRE